MGKEEAEGKREGTDKNTQVSTWNFSLQRRASPRLTEYVLYSRVLSFVGSISIAVSQVWGAGVDSKDFPRGQDPIYTGCCPLLGQTARSGRGSCPEASRPRGRGIDVMTF